MVAASLHVVLGASGGTGSAVVRELAARGWKVRAVTRGGAANVPEGVEQVAADVGTIDGARRACEGASVAHHCAQPDYTKCSAPPIHYQALRALANRLIGILPAACGIKPSTTNTCLAQRTGQTEVCSLATSGRVMSNA